MVKKKIQEAVNSQIQAEFQSAYQYLAYSAYFEEKNLSGFAHWMQVQWQEEIDHGMKFYNHLIRRDGSVDLQTIDKPKIKAESPVEVFESVLQQERYITERIHELYDLAEKEHDYPLKTLLHWFIDEQVEEEEMATEILEQLRLIGDDGPNIYLLDKELGQRQPEDESGNEPA